MVSSSKIDLTAPKLFSLKRALYLFTQVMAKGRQSPMMLADDLQMPRGVQVHAEHDQRDELPSLTWDLLVLRDLRRIPHVGPLPYDEFYRNRPEPRPSKLGMPVPP